jgi:hypothetical protein
MATTLTTNKKDYLPGETVTFTLSQFDPGSSFVFAVRDSASDPGDDGVANVYSRSGSPMAAGEIWMVW